MTRVTLKTRVWVIFSGLLTFVIVLGIITSSVYLDTRATGIDAVERLQPAADASARLLVATSDMERGVSTYVQTAKAESLGSFAEGATVSTDTLRAIKSYIGDTNPTITEMASRVDLLRDVWLRDVARPLIALVRAGKLQQAEELEISIASISRYEILRAQELMLDSEINKALTAEFAQLGNGAQLLAIVLIILFVVLIAIAFSIRWQLRRSVLKPLARLRRQLRTVARGEFKNVQIRPNGPPELHDVGVDAEDMRRQLVHEIDEAREAREELQSEAPVANAVRGALRASQPDIHGLAISGEQQTAEGLSGDWWDVVPLSNGRAAVVVADISGHSWPAAMAGLRLKDAIINELRSSEEPSRALEVGVRLFEAADSPFSTIVIVIFDPKNSVLQWANGGHLPPMILHGDGSTERLDVTGPLLSTIGGTWRTESAEITADDVVLLWTDGVTESRDVNGEQLEDEGLESMVLEAIRHVGRSPNLIVPAVIASARSASVDWDRDDATFVAVQVQPH